MPAPFVVGAILAIGAAVSGVAQGMQQREAREDAKAANKQALAIETSKNIDEARKAVARAQIARASIQAQAVNTGSTGSGMEGAMGSTMSHLAFGFGRQAMNAQAANNISDWNNSQMQHEGNANAWGMASQQLGQWSTIAFGKVK